MREQNFWGDKSIKSGRKISLCLLRSVVGRDDDSRWPNQHAASLVFSLEREAIRPVLQPFFLRPFRVEVVQKDSLVSNIVLLKPIPPPSKDSICNFFFIKIRRGPRLGWFLLRKIFFVGARILSVDVGGLPTPWGPHNPGVVKVLQLRRRLGIFGGHFGNCGVVSQLDITWNFLQSPPFRRIPGIIPPLNLHLPTFEPMPTTLGTMMSLVTLVLGPLSKFREVAILASVLNIVLSRPLGHLEPALAKLLEGLTGLGDSIFKHDVPLQVGRAGAADFASKAQVFHLGGPLGQLFWDISIIVNCKHPSSCPLCPCFSPTSSSSPSADLPTTSATSATPSTPADLLISSPPKAQNRSFYSSAPACFMLTICTCRSKSIFDPSKPASPASLSTTSATPADLTTSLVAPQGLITNAPTTLDSYPPSCCLPLPPTPSPTIAFKTTLILMISQYVEPFCLFFC